MQLLELNHESTKPSDLFGWKLNFPNLPIFSGEISRLVSIDF